MSDGHGIPASWYPDPADSRRQRYWDGSAWTQQTRDDAAGAALDASAANAPISDFTGYDRVGQSASYVPFSSGSAAVAAAQLRPERGSASTIAIWLYAFVPLLLLLHLPFSWDFTIANFNDLLIHGALGVVTVVLAILLAVIDRGQLQRRGYERTPPAMLGVLPPIHIIARLFTTSPVAVLVTLASLIVQGVVVALLVLPSLPSAPIADSPTAEPPTAAGMTEPFTEQQLAYLLTPKGMAEKIRFDAASTSVAYETVQCDPLPSADLGAQTTCHATAQLADYDLLVQVLINGDSVPFVVVSITPVLE